MYWLESLDLLQSFAILYLLFFWNFSAEGQYTFRELFIWKEHRCQPFDYVFFHYLKEIPFYYSTVKPHTTAIKNRHKLFHLTDVVLTKHNNFLALLQLCCINLLGNELTHLCDCPIDMVIHVVICVFTLVEPCVTYDDISEVVRLSVYIFQVLLLKVFTNLCQWMLRIFKLLFDLEKYLL